MPYVSDQELARLQYVLTRAIDEARALDLGPGPEPDASDRIEFALTEALIFLRVVEGRRRDLKGYRTRNGE